MRVESEGALRASTRSVEPEEGRGSCEGEGGTEMESSVSLYDCKKMRIVASECRELRKLFTLEHYRRKDCSHSG